MLFLEHGGDYECGGYTEVLPIEHSDKETAYVELSDIIQSIQKSWDNYHKSYTEWASRQPPRLKEYHGKNRLALEKHARSRQNAEVQYKEWHGQQPEAPSTWDISFCGHTISVNEISVDDIQILTLDEWYSQNFV